MSAISIYRGYNIHSLGKGQLGQGDLLPRSVFTLIKKLRGVQASHIVTGTDLCYAISEKSDVYVWGGGGVGEKCLVFFAIGMTGNSTHRNTLRATEQGEQEGGEGDPSFEPVAGASDRGRSPW